MAEQERHLKLRDTPGGIITAYAHSYAVKFFDYADQKLPDFKAYPSEARYTWMQAAIIVAALIQTEKAVGGADRDDLHDNVSRAFAPPVRHRCLSAIQDLSAALLQSNRADISPEAIPAYASLAGADDKKLRESVGGWVCLNMTKKRELGPADLTMAAAIGRSAWTSATMIVRMIQPKRK
jgi:hypothetical protein